MNLDGLKEAAYFEELADSYVQCGLCPHRCVIADGKRGRCQARENRGGKLYALTYGRAASLAVDPIEKKPLYHFYPGREILSLGNWGCNFACSFCQNHDISQHEVPTRAFSPEDAVTMARESKSIGLAYTYNEPLINFEFVRDCAKVIRAAGLKNVLVTNGFVNPEPLEELLPLVDAMNIDIKAFHEGFYKDQCQGKLEPVLRNTARAAKSCHVEVTTLLIPGLNDAPKELEDMAVWIAENCGEETPAHLSAYFPRYQMKIDATTPAMLQHAREIFLKHLRYVYIGNVAATKGANTVCRACGEIIIARQGYAIDKRGINDSGRCALCGADNNIINETSFRKGSS